MLKIGELFAGYGGLGMGVMELLDAEVAWVSEFDKHPSTILKTRFPDAPNLGDITKIDWTKVEPVDVLTGGSPCQDLSQAGQRLGMKAGTRSGLWVNMLKAITTLKPKLVIWENVGGAFSAEATSEMEPCPGCVGHGDGGAILRALGRVLGDLTEAGYDAEWHSLRAADIGAPHGRLRVFVTAWPRETGKPRLAGRALTANRDHSGRGEQRGAIPSPPEHATLERNHTLLPTPAVNDMGAAYDPESWDQWTEKMKQAHGNGNGHGKSLNIEALRMLPTPRATDGTKGGPNQRGSKGDLMLPSAAMSLLPTQITEREEDDSRNKDRTTKELPGLRSPAGTEKVQRSAGGLYAILEPENVLQHVRQQQDDCPSGHPSMEGAQDSEPLELRNLRGDKTTPRASQRQGRDKQCRNESPSLVRDLPPETSLEDRPNREAQIDFREYTAAIERWEAVLGRRAPAPTLPTGKEGKHQLSAIFVEFLMGLPAGWVTDIPIPRNAQLKALGNGVVPQQAAEALRRTLDPHRVFFIA